MAAHPTDRPFSRRAFLAGAGSLTAAFVAPLVPGQRVPDAASSPFAALGADTAYADDAKFEFEAVSATDVQCIALDVTSIDKGTTTPVKDASITVNGLDDQKDRTQTFTTNEKGSTVFNLCYFMKNYDSKTGVLKKGKEPSDGIYAVDVAASLRAKGYRQVDIKRVNLVGGKGLGLPLYRLTGENDDAYFRSLSFDGYDIQYTTATFMHSSGNDEQHEIAAELYLKEIGEANVSFYRWRSDSNVFPGIVSDDDANERNGITRLASCDASISDSEIAKRKQQDAKDERAMANKEEYDKAAYENRWVRKVSISERFLQTSFNRALHEGDRVIVCLTVQGKRTAYLTGAQFEHATIDQVDSGTWDSLPGLSSSDLHITIPERVPAIGGLKLGVSWMPKTPIIFEVNPLGYMMIGLSFAYAGETDEDEKGPFVKDNWKVVKLEDAKAQYKEQKDKMDKLWKNYKTIREEWNKREERKKNGLETKRTSAKLFSGFEASIAVQAKAYLSYASFDGTLKGGLHAIVALTAEGEFGWNVTVFGIPFYLAFFPSAQLALQAGIALVGTWPSGDEDVADKAKRFFQEINLSWNDTQVAATLDIGIGVEAGVGVYGAVSLGARGSASLTIYTAFFDGSGYDAADGGHEFPHARVGAGLDLSICAQFFLFKASKQIAAISWPTLYDSWGIEKDPDIVTPFSLGVDGNDSEHTGTSLPDEFVLSRAQSGIALLDGDGAPSGEGSIATDENGNFAFTFETFLEAGQGTTQNELAKSSELGVTPKAQAATLSSNDELTLVAKYVPADENSNVAAYDLVLVSASEEREPVATSAIEVEQADTDADAAAPAVAAVAGAATLADSNGDEGKVSVNASESTAGSASAASSSEDNDAEDGENDGDTGSGTDDAEDDLLYDDQGNVLDFSADEVDVDAEAEGNHLTNGGIAGATAGVAGIGDDGALTPNADNTFLKEVYSDGRVRIVKLGGRTMMLRIATIGFEDGYRTCLVYQIRSSEGWSEPRAVSFSVDGIKGISRFDLFDYDFDAYQKDENAVVIALLSGTRAKDADTNLVSACTNPVTSIIVLTRIYGQPIVSLARSWRSFDGGAELSTDDSLYFTFAPCVSLTYGGKIDTDNSGNRFPCYISGAFLYRRANGSDVLKDSTPTHIAGFCLRAVCSIEKNDGRGDAYRWALTSTRTFEMEGAPSSVSALSIGTVSNRRYANFIVGYESAEGCGFFDTLFSHSYSYEGYKYVGSMGMTVRKDGHYRYIKRLLRVSDSQCLGVDSNNVLCERRDNGFAPVAPYEVQTNDDGAEVIVPAIPVSATLSGDRTFLVWSENREGINGFEYGNQTDKPQATYEDGRYRIMASRAVTSGDITLFTRPFTLCQVSYPVDSIASVTCEGSAVRIIASSITNLDYSLSDYHEITLPITALATPTSMVAPDVVLFPGLTADMEVTLRNDGNTQLSAVTLAITDKDGKQLADPREIDFGPDTVVTCPGAKPNPEDSLGGVVFNSGFSNVYSLASGMSGTPFDADAFAAHPLVANEGRDYLTPGGKAVVDLPLDVPQDWSGKVTLSVAVTGLKFVNPVNGAIVEAAGAGVTAASGSDGNISSAGIAAISDETLAAATKPFEEENSVEVSMSETLDADSFRMGELRSSQVVESGTEVPDEKKDDGSGTDSDGSGNNDGSNGNGNSRGGDLATTGDHAAGFGAAGALALLAGAGLAAYSRRRMQVAAEAEAQANAEAESDESEQ